MGVVLVRRCDSQVDVVVDGLTQSWRFHDTQITRQHLDAWVLGESAQLRPHGLLVLEGGGCLYPCLDSRQWRDCQPPAMTG